MSAEIIAFPSRKTASTDTRSAAEERHEEAGASRDDDFDMSEDDDKYLSFESRTDRLKTLFVRLTTDPQVTEEERKSDCDEFASCLDEGDGDLVITWMVREAARTGLFRLDAALDQKRERKWRDIATRHRHLEDGTLANVATWIRRSQAAAHLRWKGAVICMGHVEDDAVEPLLAALRANLERSDRLDVHIYDHLDHHCICVSQSDRPDPTALARRWKIAGEIIESSTGIIEMCMGW